MVEILIIYHLAQRARKARVAKQQAQMRHGSD
jgi:hypothetical protein